MAKIGLKQLENLRSYKFQQFYSHWFLDVTQLGRFSDVQVTDDLNVTDDVGIGVPTRNMGTVL